MPQRRKAGEPTGVAEDRSSPHRREHSCGPRNFAHFALPGGGRQASMKGKRAGTQPGLCPPFIRRAARCSLRFKGSPPELLGLRTGSWLHKERVEMAPQLSVRPDHADFLPQPLTPCRVRFLALASLSTSFCSRLPAAVHQLQPPVNEIWRAAAQTAVGPFISPPG